MGGTSVLIFLGFHAPTVLPVQYFFKVKVNGRCKSIKNKLSAASGVFLEYSVNMESPSSLWA